ncbi:MAG: sulfurtransferase TusA family protein [Muricomes sp.]
MREVDARGLSCPEPMMLTAEALKSTTEPVKVLVTEPHQKANIEKYAKVTAGLRCNQTEDGFEITIS